MRATATSPGSLRAAVVPGLVAALSVIVLGPSLSPGFTLVGDQVFVPDQSLLPWMLGLGAGLPRSVPQDAVVAVLTGPVPGWVWESVALVAALLLLGTGVARLLRGAGLAARSVAAVIAVWSPYVAERLLLGHWSLLLALGALPWSVAAADAARRGTPRAGARWLLWVALASLTPTGGVLVLLVSVPVLLWRRPTGRPWATAALGAVLQLPWVVPALAHPGSPPPGGVEVFALRPEGWWGAVLTALGTGGAWNADATPASRATVLAPLLTIVLLALAWYGRRATVRLLGAPVALTLAVTGGALLLVTVLGALEATRPIVRVLVEDVPGGGLLRDGQKWLAPWLLLLAGAAGAGTGRLLGVLRRRTGERLVGRVVAVGLVLAPVVAMPDLTWGALGRLSSVAYPDDWQRAREVLAAADAGSGDVVSLPWSTFRQFDWNLGRTVLDPSTRAMPRTVVADDSLVVRRGDRLVVVAGEDPRSARVGGAVTDPDRLAAVLRDVGVGWVLVTHVPGPAAVLPAGAARVLEGADLDLYRLPEPRPAPSAGAATVAGVVAADGLALVTLLGAVLVRSGAGRRRDRGEPEPS